MMFGMLNGDRVVSPVPVSDHKSPTCRAALETAPSYGPVNTFSVRLRVCECECVCGFWSGLVQSVFLGSLNQQQQRQQLRLHH